MTIKAILFDLDGTLLEHDMRSDFLPHYFESLGKYFAHLVPPKKLIQGIMLGSEAITENDGSVTNEEAFAQVFYPYINFERKILEPEFRVFYIDIFPILKQYTARKPEARDVVKTMFQLGYRVVIATNPYFPYTAIQQRMEWAGVDDLPYDRITSYENCHFAKPNPMYFQEIVDEIGCKPEEALVVGDEAMDMIAGIIGCQTFLVKSTATIVDEIRPEPTYQGTLSNVKSLLTAIPRS